MQYVFVASLFVSTALAACSALAQPPASARTESLGNRLLEDLPSEAAPPSATNPPNNRPIDQVKEPRALAPAERRTSAAPTATAMVPLAHIQQGMQRAESILALSGDATDGVAVSKAGAVQVQVLSDLDALIAELSKQCQCQGGSAAQPPQPGAKNSPKPNGQPTNASTRSAAPAPDSTERVDGTRAEPVDRTEIREVVKALWGHLPERSRTPLLQSFSDEFLPKYEREIEQYYRRLGEERSNAPASLSRQQ